MVIQSVAAAAAHPEVNLQTNIAWLNKKTETVYVRNNIMQNIDILHYEINVKNEAIRFWIIYSS